MYRAYYGAAGCGAISPMEKDRWPFKEFAHLDQAVLWTRAVVKKGTAVIAIDGDDGTRMGRSEIASWCAADIVAGD